MNNTFTKRFEHIMSIHFKLEQPRWGFRSDLSKTVGYLGQRNLLGVMAMPIFNATDKLQFVARYTFLDSDGINGLSLATYENKVVTGRGDRYTEGYLGVNYYFYGHRLKLQSGVQFADMQRSCKRRRRLFGHVVDDGACASGGNGRLRHGQQVVR